MHLAIRNLPLLLKLNSSKFIAMEEPVEETQPKRVPAKECFINEIKGNETRVAIVASVVSVNRAKKTALVSDNAKEALLKFDDLAKMRGIKEGTILRVIAKPLSLQPVTLQVELAQELKDFDANLFKKVKELWAKFV